MDKDRTAAIKISNYIETNKSFTEKVKSYKEKQSTSVQQMDDIDLHEFFLFFFK